MPTIDPDTTSGTQLAAHLNSWQDAIETMHRGAGAPSYLKAGMMYLDDAADPVWSVMFSADGVALNVFELFQIDTDNDAPIFNPAYLDATGTDDDDLLAIVGGVPTFAPISSIQIDPSTDFNSGLVPNANLPAAMRLGTDDTTAASLYLYGDSATQGGLVRLYNSASEDTTIEYWHIEANNVLRMGTNVTATLFELNASQMTFYGGTIAVGVADTTRGRIFLYGDNNTLGGTLYLYAAANDDTTYDYFTAQAESNALWIGPDTDGDMYTFRGDGRLELTAAGFRAMTHTYTNPSSGTGVELLYSGADDTAQLLSVTRPSTYKKLQFGGSIINVGGLLLGNGPITLGFESTACFIVFSSLTTTERNALTMTGYNNAIIWNETTVQYERWNGTAWAAL